MNRRPIPSENQHFSEPEIIPPNRPDREGKAGATWTRIFVDDQGVHRISVTKVGPLGLIAFWVVAGLLGAALLIFFLGAFVFLLPLLGVLLVIGIVASVFRAFSRRRF